MRWLGRWLFRLLLLFALGIGLVWAFAPRETLGVPPDRDLTGLAEDPESWLAEREAEVAGLRPAARKRIVWAGEAGARTALSVVYVHGFSASAEEIRPVPDQVAATLGANLHFTRLRGHGRDGAAMAEPTAADWIADVEEAVAIGEAIGERVLLLSTSTGGTLAAIHAARPAAEAALAGVVFVSPNFGVANPLAAVMSWPGVRHWAPLLLGPERGFDPHNEGQAAHWTTRYPTVAVLPMSPLIEHALAQPLETLTVPALFLFSQSDKVVSPAATAQVAERWGGGASVVKLVPGAEDDPDGHVLAGDIMSPGMTDQVVAQILEWVSGL